MQEALLPPWDAYRRLQTRAKSTSTINSHSWGLEEEMNLFLDDPGAYVSAKTDTQLKKANATAARRERAHAQMRKEHLAELAPQPPNPEPQNDAKEKLKLIQGSLTPHSWQIMLKIGQGHTHTELASEVGIKPGTMRVMVSRLRAQVAHLYAA